MTGLNKFQCKYAECELLDEVGRGRIGKNGELQLCNACYISLKEVLTVISDQGKTLCDWLSFFISPKKCGDSMHTFQCFLSCIYLRVMQLDTSCTDMS